MLVIPLTLVPCATASILWLLINAALWAISTALLADIVSMRWPAHRSSAVALASLVSLGFWPAFEGLFLGQAHLVILFSLTSALWLAERRHPGWAGSALAFGAAVKYFPVAVIIYALARGRFRLVAGAAIAGLGLVAAMLASPGQACSCRAPRRRRRGAGDTWRLGRVPFRGPAGGWRRDSRFDWTGIPRGRATMPRRRTAGGLVGDRHFPARLAISLVVLSGVVDARLLRLLRGTWAADDERLA